MAPEEKRITDESPPDLDAQFAKRMYIEFAEGGDRIIIRDYNNRESNALMERLEEMQEDTPEDAQGEELLKLLASYCEDGEAALDLLWEIPPFTAMDILAWLRWPQKRKLEVPPTGMIADVNIAGTKHSMRIPSMRDRQNVIATAYDILFDIEEEAQQESEESVLSPSSLSSFELSWVKVAAYFPTLSFADVMELSPLDSLTAIEAIETELAKYYKSIGRETLSPPVRRRRRRKRRKRR